MDGRFFCLLWTGIQSSVAGSFLSPSCFVIGVHQISFIIVLSCASRVSCVNSHRRLGWFPKGSGGPIALAMVLRDNISQSLRENGLRTNLIPTNPSRLFSTRINQLPPVEHCFLASVYFAACDAKEVVVKYLQHECTVFIGSDGGKRLHSGSFTWLGNMLTWTRKARVKLNEYYRYYWKSIIVGQHGISD